MMGPAKKGPNKADLEYKMEYKNNFRASNDF